MADSNKLPDNDEIIELTEIIEKGAVPTDSDFLKSLGLDEDDVAEKNSLAADRSASPAQMPGPDADDLFADLDSTDTLSLDSMPDLDSIISDLDVASAASPDSKSAPAASAKGVMDDDDLFGSLLDSASTQTPLSTDAAPPIDATGNVAGADISEDDLLADLFAEPAQKKTPPRAEADPDDILGDLLEPQGAASASNVPLDALDLTLDTAATDQLPPDDGTSSLPDLKLLDRDTPPEDPRGELRDMSEDALFSEIIKQAQAKPESAVKRKPSPPRSSLNNRRGNDLSLFGGNQTIQTTIDEISGQSASQASSAHVDRDDSLLDDLLNMPAAPPGPPDLTPLSEFGATELSSMEEYSPAPKSPKDLFTQAAAASGSPAASVKGAVNPGSLDDSDLFADLLDESVPQKNGKAPDPGKSLEDDLFADLAPAGGKSEEDDLFGDLEAGLAAAPADALKDIAADGLDDLGSPQADNTEADKAAPELDLDALLDESATPGDVTLDALDSISGDILGEAPDNLFAAAPDDLSDDTSGDEPHDVAEAPAASTSDAFDLPDTPEAAGSAVEPDEIESLDLGELDHAVAELEEEIAQPQVEAMAEATAETTGARQLDQLVDQQTDPLGEEPEDLPQPEQHVEKADQAPGSADSANERPRFDTPELENIDETEDLEDGSFDQDQDLPQGSHDEDTSELDALLDDVIAAAPPISRAGLFSSDKLEKIEQVSENDFSIQNLTNMLIGRMDKLESAIRLHSKQAPQSAAKGSTDSPDLMLEALQEGSPLFEQLLSALETRMRAQAASPASLSPELMQNLQENLTLKVQEQVMETLDSRIDELVSAKLADFAADRDSGLEQISSYVKESLQQDLERSAAAAAAKVIKEEILALLAENPIE